MRPIRPTATWPANQPMLVYLTPLLLIIFVSVTNLALGFYVAQWLGRGPKRWKDASLPE